MPSASIKQLTIWSPLLMIAVLFLVAFLVGNLVGAWVWIPIALVYWALIAISSLGHLGTLFGQCL